MCGPPHPEASAGLATHVDEPAAQQATFSHAESCLGDSAARPADSQAAASLLAPAPLPVPLPATPTANAPRFNKDALSVRIPTAPCKEVNYVVKFPTLEPEVQEFENELRNYAKRCDIKGCSKLQHHNANCIVIAPPLALCV